MTRDEMREVVAEVLNFPTWFEPSEFGAWKALMADQIVDALGLEQVGWRCIAHGFVTDKPVAYDGGPVCPEGPTEPVYRLRGES